MSIFFGYLLAIFSLEHTLILFSGVWFPYMFKNIFSSTRKRLYLHAFAVLMAFIAPCAVCAGLIAAYVTGSVTDVVQFYYSFVPVYGVYGVMTALVGLTVWKLMGTKLQTAERVRLHAYMCPLFSSITLMLSDVSCQSISSLLYLDSFLILTVVV